jgi:hypothetical protein
MAALLQRFAVSSVSVAALTSPRVLRGEVGSRSDPGEGQGTLFAGMAVHPTPTMTVRAPRASPTIETELAEAAPHPTLSP